MSEALPDFDIRPLPLAAMAGLDNDVVNLKRASPDKIKKFKLRMITVQFINGDELSSSTVQLLLNAGVSVVSGHYYAVIIVRDRTAHLAKIMRLSEERTLTTSSEELLGLLKADGIDLE